MESVILYGTALAALYFCAPGFLPKEMKHYLFGLFASPRGHGFLLFLALLPPVLLTASRLQKKGVVSTLTGGSFAVFSGAMLLHFLIDVLCRAPALAVWVLRLLWVSGWVFGARQALDLASAARNKWKAAKEAARFEKILLFLILFFLVRQTFAFFYNRGMPNNSDETNFWYVAAMDFIKGGFSLVMQRHNYTLAVPWLASLPAQVFGVTENAEVAFAYSSFVFFGMVLLAIELSKNARALLAGLGTLLLCFTIQRDLFSLYAATLYGEATAALLCAVLLAEFLPLSLKANPSRGALLCFHGIVAYASVSKPPLAYLVWFFPVFFLFKKTGWENRMLSLSAAAALYLPWRLQLALLHKSTYYAQFKASDAFAQGINLFVPAGIVAGLLNRGTPQSAFTISLLIALSLAFLRSKYALLKTYAALLAAYWGFVFALYATLWQNGDLLSTGRYVSHAAVACVILLPLAFSKPNAHA